MIHEVLMYYHLKDELKYPICTMMEQLGVKTVEIKEEDVNETMGYLLKVPGFAKSEGKQKKIPEDTFLFFAGMTMEQLDIILEVFKNAGIPYIPLKAMLTNDNIQYPFYVLHENVNKEYLSLKNKV
jgi:hypothetical protein